MLSCVLFAMIRRGLSSFEIYTVETASINIEKILTETLEILDLVYIG